MQRRLFEKVIRIEIRKHKRRSIRSLHVYTNERFSESFCILLLKILILMELLNLYPIIVFSCRCETDFYFCFRADYSDVRACVYSWSQVVVLPVLKCVVRRMCCCCSSYSMSCTVPYCTPARFLSATWIFVRRLYIHCPGC